MGLGWWHHVWAQPSRSLSISLDSSRRSLEACELAAHVCSPPCGTGPVSAVGTGGPTVLVVASGDADLGRTSFGVHPSEGARTLPMSFLCWERRFLVFSFPSFSTCYGCAVLPSVCSRGSERPLRAASTLSTGPLVSSCLCFP